MPFKIGDMVYSRVYGYAVVKSFADSEYIALEVPGDDEFVVHVSSLMKVGTA